MTAPTRLVPRSRPATADRLALSAATPEGSGPATDAVPGWLAAHRRAGGAVVHRIPFAELDNWSFAPRTGNLRHSSGRFFTIEGLHVSGPDSTWQQPIIVQPEIGILGILAQEFDGVLHFLMQAKMEPGNPNLVQLSPTVQATRSNYTQAHGGAAVKYLEHFLAPEPERVLTDVLQSEHGSWFYRKRNRNMIVEVAADVDVPVDDAFCWLTLGQLAQLLRLDNVVNMDARTVLASAPTRTAEPMALSSDAGLLAWFTGERARHEVRTRRMPLREISGWQTGEHAVSRPDGRFFDVVAVRVEGAGREVAAGASRSSNRCVPESSASRTASSTACPTSWRTPASRAVCSTPRSSRPPCSASRRIIRRAPGHGRPSWTRCSTRRPSASGTRPSTPRRAGGSSTPRAGI